MLLFFIVLMFFLLHIQFLLRNVLFGTYETTYFEFTTSYLFSRDIAIESLWFSIGSAIAFATSYLWAYRAGRTPRTTSSGAELNAGCIAQAEDANPILKQNLATARRIFAAFAIMQISANIILAYSSDFTYQTMAETLESSGFIFELRLFLLAALAFIVLNIRPSAFWRDRDYRLVRILLVAYGISILIVQARSRVFEFPAILVYAYLMWTGDRVRWRYLIMLAIALLIPNLIVLGRLGVPSDMRVLADGLFSFEYSVTLNNFLGAAIERSYATIGELTFLKSLWLLIPSPIRALMNIDVVKSSAYEALAGIAQVRNGGYSMLAEMFQNFGWFGIGAFAVMGASMGALNRRASQVGRVSILIATAPLIYAAFIIAFRNDFGVFLKFVVQALIVASLLRMTMRSPASPHILQGSARQPQASLIATGQKI